MLLIVIFLSFFTSCQQDEILLPDEPVAIVDPVEKTVDTVAFRAQLKSFVNLTVEAVVDTLKKKSGLKDGEIFTHNILTAVSSRNYYVEDDRAVKVYDYLKRTTNYFWDEELTIYQIFKIIDGKIDPENYTINYEVGPPSGSRSFWLNSTRYLERVSFHWHSNKDSQIDYYIEYNGDDNFILPDYEDGYWQLGFEYRINGVWKYYVSERIDYYAESNELKLKLQLDDPNTVATIEVLKSLIIGAQTMDVQGYDVNGEYHYMSIPVAYDESMPDIITYDLPIDPEYVWICGEHSCDSYETTIVGLNGDISIFHLKEREW